MKYLLNYLLIPLLILNFFSFNFLNNDLRSNIYKFNINYQNQATENYSKYSENSISSQQFIDDLESVPENGTYELQANVDFSDSENDDVTGIKLNNITINGNGYTLYNRDITEIFNTDTFEVSEEHDGLGYYSFFTEISYCYIYNLNFDNFMLPFGVIWYSTLKNINSYNMNYQNLTFNVNSYNIYDQFSHMYDSEIEINIATIGLFAQALFDSSLFNINFENINFSDNTIILLDDSISVVVAPIGNITIENHNSFSVALINIYLNDISFINNEFISEINNDNFSKESEEQEKYFSIFYSPFIGSATTDRFDTYDAPNIYISDWEQIIFNNINISGNSNNFANYTFYSLLPPISGGVTFYGRNIYGFNLNLDIQLQLDNNENVAIGNLSDETYYPSEDFFYTGIYQTDWISDVYYENIVLNYTSFLDNESMIEQIYEYNYEYFYKFNSFWYYDKLNTNQDYSFILADKPTIIYKADDFYDKNEESIDFYISLIDGRYNQPTKSVYYSNYNINLINKNNNEIIWTGYAEYAPFDFEISIDSDLLFENNLYFEISNDYHIWDQDVDFRKYLPEIYNVSSFVEDDNLIVSYDFIDSYNLINSIDISLYDNLNNEIESKTIDYNNLENKYYLNSDEISFTTKIYDPNNYYLKMEVNCNIYKFYDPNLTIKSLDNNLIQYDENSDIEFRTQSILPNDNKSIAIWLIILIVIIALVLILIFIFLIYYFMIKNKKKI
ncbi:/ / hypothetical protein / 592641:594827 Reverse [Candidatus Hepatoplasma crinochetorum]|uniref:Uncharacterized protein n=1 Tax=Candidatus Hepatoplasma crinochetorum TaxID=295596 RepID=A0A0G7ZN49_9MOLU|nr:/ / hypothetical protein / 592641:594827 Reverse [Candidatus Hepatoplasma crinochetorum]